MVRKRGPISRHIASGLVAVLLLAASPAFADNAAALSRIRADLQAARSEAQLAQIGFWGLFAIGVGGFVLTLGSLSLDPSDPASEALLYGGMLVTTGSGAGMYLVSRMLMSAPAEVERLEGAEVYVRRGSVDDRAALAISKQTVYVGMPRAAVIHSWGRPQAVNATTTTAGRSEQLVYGLSSYVYIDDGAVSTIQN